MPATIGNPGKTESRHPSSGHNAAGLVAGGFAEWAGAKVAVLVAPARPRESRPNSSSLERSRDRGRRRPCRWTRAREARDQHGAAAQRVPGRRYSAFGRGAGGIGRVKVIDQQPVFLVGGRGEDFRRPGCEEGIGGGRPPVPPSGHAGRAGVAERRRNEGGVRRLVGLAQIRCSARSSGRSLARSRPGRAASGRRRTGCCCAV